ncbi:MAG: InlB B-repeat-containing protein [Planctomycetota bacterium]|jgi:hypothetical protein
MCFLPENIEFHRLLSRRLRGFYATNGYNGTTWSIQVADDQTDSEYWDRITFEFDTSGNPHLAYHAPESDIRGLRHADRSSGGTWTQGTILPGRSLRRPESVNFGNSRFGLAFVDAYWSDDDYEGIYYVEYSGGHWGTPNGIIPGDMDRKSMSIAIAPQTVAGYAAAAQPAVAFIEYQAGGGESLKYAYRDGIFWHRIHVGTTITDYGYSALTFGNDGLPRVAVRDSSDALDQALRVASPYTTLAVNVDPAGSGTVIVNPDQAFYSGSDIVVLDPQANSSWRFSHWMGDVPEGRENDDPLTVVTDRRRSLTAHFAEVLTLTASVSPGGAGTVTVVPEKDWHDLGEVVQVQARPAENAVFLQWTADVPAGHETDNPLDLTMDQSRHLVANFYVRMGAISGIVWNDQNGSGVRDATEPGIEGVPITLYRDDGDLELDRLNGDELVASTVTNVGGLYEFFDLNAGVYWVDVDETSETLTGFALTAGPDPLLLDLAAGQAYDQASFGFAPPTPGAPPEINTIDLDATSINENDTVELAGTFTDADLTDTHYLTITWGDGSTDTRDLPVGDRSFTATHQYLDDGLSGTPSDVYAVIVNVSDNDGADMASAEVTVNNVAPVITSLSATPETIDENGLVTLSGTFSDPGTQDTFILVVDWGEGDPETVILNEAVRDFALSHQYLDDNPSGTPSDVYTITVTLTDDDIAHASPVLIDFDDIDAASAPVAATGLFDHLGVRFYSDGGPA